MAWNEPGGGNKDPWGGRGDQGPPDLDEIVRKMKTKFSGLFGARPRKPSSGLPSMGGVGVLIAVAVVLWLVYDMTYVIEPAQRGVVTRFGAYVDTLQPGPNIRFPRPIERVYKIDVDQVRSVPHKAQMLTKDENIVEVKLAVQYKVKDARAYLFNVRDPDFSLMQAVQSALREVVGKSAMEYVITDGRDAIAVSTQQLTQHILDKYRTGLQVVKVNLQDANPPEQVKDAFDDAIKAREDEQRLKNEAEAYANEVIPKARGGAARQLEDAEAYRAQVTAEAQGNADRFTALLGAYERAPQVTRQRLYLDAMESVLSRTSKVLIDTKSDRNIIYLPLDKLTPGHGSDSSGDAARIVPPVTGPTAKDDVRQREELRNRGQR
ncbi:MAG: FtsH protease activity modulator HflK [Gammaproteobacteria bacterium]